MGLDRALSAPEEFPSEIRRDYRDGHLSIVSRKRSRDYIESILSDEYKISSSTSKQTNYSSEDIAKCPFEPGKESLNIEILRVGNPWRIRVIENKYPSLINSAPRHSKKSEDGMFSLVGGYGVHEVLIESAKHEDIFEYMSQQQINEILRILSDREQALYKKSGIKFVQILRNYGSRAGASIPHPHSQILAWPLLPTTIKVEGQKAKAYFEKHQECLYEHALEGELYGGRVLAKND